jgi:hypothetical protein
MGNSQSSTSTKIVHPFTPSTLELTNYVPISHSMTEMVALAAGIFVVASGAAFLVGRTRFQGDVKKMAVFMHHLVTIVFLTVFGGYFTLYHASIVSDTSIFADIWKWYGVGDTRYVISDDTIVWNSVVYLLLIIPLYGVCAWALATGHAIYHTARFTAGVMDLYAALMNLLTAYQVDWMYQNPSTFYTMFVVFNAFYLLPPVYWIADSSVELTAVMKAAQDKADKEE